MQVKNQLKLICVNVCLFFVVAMHNSRIHCKQFSVSVTLSPCVWQSDEKPQTGLFTGKHGSDIRLPSHTLTTLFHIMIDHLLQIHIVLSAMTIKNEAHQNKTNKPEKSTYSSQL